MDTSKLAPETRQVWEVLSAEPALGGFILIGGSALAMHIGHRVSEDLDFIKIALKLPLASLSALMAHLERAGFSVSRDDDLTAYEEFLIAGESLHDYQQNFLINGVRLNLFTPDSDVAGMFAASSEPLARVATLLELFRTKALACANRSASRDWLDLYVLLRHYGFTLRDFHEAFHQPSVHNPAQTISRAFQNLCRGASSPTDPGYESLMPEPPSLKQLATYFTTMREQYEIELARNSFRKTNGGG